jgi:hypothetical protein
MEILFVEVSLQAFFLEMTMEFLNIFEAAKKLGCCAQTVRNLVHRGKIKRFEGTPVFLFDPQEIEKIPKVKRGRPRNEVTEK